MSKMKNFNTTRQPINQQEETTSTMKTKTIPNSHTLCSAVLLLAAIAGTSGAWAQLAQPSGIAEVTIPASRTEVFGMPFARGVVTSGKITGTSVANNNATFTVTLNAGEPSIPALNNTSTSADSDHRYVFEILDGPAIGFLLACTGNSGNSSVTVEGSTGSIDVPAGTNFAIRKDNTISSVFGAPSANHPFGSGASAIDASVKAWVQVFNVATGTLTSYYINTVGTPQWRSTAGPTDRTTVRLPLGRAVIIANRTTSDITFPVSGQYRIARSRFSVPAGKLTFLANPSPLASTFSDATIQATTPNRNTSSGGVGDVNTSDLWQIWNPATRTFASYFVGTTTNGIPAILRANGTEQNPAISAFKGVAVKPLGSGSNVVVTVAPKL